MKRELDALKICLLVLMMISLSGCNNVVEIEHVEAFMAETSVENEEGFSEPNGYKKVNSITTVEEGEDYRKTDIKSIEDYFDVQGYYVKTEIIHSNYHKSLKTNREESDQSKEIIRKPSTILLSDEIADYFQIYMSDLEKEEMKDHILTYIEKEL